MTQVSKFCNQIQSEEAFQLIRVIEVFERDWRVKDKILRPEHHMLGHTAFLVFARRML